MLKGILVVESKSMHAVTMQMHSYAILYHDFRSDQISTRLSTIRALAYLIPYAWLRLNS